MEPLCSLIGVIPSTLTFGENILLESELFLRICDELKEIFKMQHKEYFRLLRLTIEKENTMLESNLARLVIQDILFTGEYTLEGIAHYTQMHEDVIQEIFSGLNQNPSAILLRKIIELHRKVRYDLYCSLAKKIISKYLSMVR